MKPRKSLTKTVIEDERKKSKIKQKNPLKFAVAVSQLTTRIAEHFFTCRKSDREKGIVFNTPIISPNKEKMARQIIFNLGEFLINKDKKVIRRKSLEVISRSPKTVETVVLQAFKDIFRMQAKGENLDACNKIIGDILQWKKTKKKLQKD